MINRALVSFFHLHLYTTFFYFEIDLFVFFGRNVCGATVKWAAFFPACMRKLYANINHSWLFCNILLCRTSPKVTFIYFRSHDLFPLLPQSLHRFTFSILLLILYANMGFVCPHIQSCRVFIFDVRKFIERLRLRKFDQKICMQRAALFEVFFSLDFIFFAIFSIFPKLLLLLLCFCQFHVTMRSAHKKNPGNISSLWIQA